jgi:hypothetical protein
MLEDIRKVLKVESLQEKVVKLKVWPWACAIYEQKWNPFGANKSGYVDVAIRKIK